MINTSLVGRNRETRLLLKLSGEQKAHLVALYGRRRVGKTFLVRSLFSTREHYFELTGLHRGKLGQQLQNFALALQRTFYPTVQVASPSSWREAFLWLGKALRTLPPGAHPIVFLDELPWLATRRSGCLEALEYSWNTELCQIPNLLLIACGSAASWMLDNVIHGKGGLYNRVSRSILLQPFTIAETASFLRSKSIHLPPKHALDLYMTIGGIPFYLEQIDRGSSVAQSINELCFNADGGLYDEFPRLFSSLFEKSTIHESIVRALAKKPMGLSRGEIQRVTGQSSGGTFNKQLKELEAAGFIRSFVPWGFRRKYRFFRIIDEYSLFFLNWIEPYRQRAGSTIRTNYWLAQTRTPAYQAWKGLAFETMALKHHQQIETQLGITNIPKTVGSWRYIARAPHEDGAQIDLLFDRDDGTINLCELKYSDQKYSIDKTYFRSLLRKLRVFRERTKTKKHLLLVLVTACGASENRYFHEVVDNQVCATDWVT